MASQLLVEARLGLTKDVAASSFLDEETPEEVGEFTDQDTSVGQGSFSPHDGQNLKFGCNFIPHWEQKWKGILKQ